MFAFSQLQSLSRVYQTRVMVIAEGLITQYYNSTGYWFIKRQHADYASYDDSCIYFKDSQNLKFLCLNYNL
jgi:hypothetical protein